jgi:hypothetical protein
MIAILQKVSRKALLPRPLREERKPREERKES